MQEKNIIKNNLLKSLNGIPTGISILLLSYGTIYFILGESAFNYELIQLHNIKILFGQILFSGLIWYFIYFNFNILITFFNMEIINKKYLFKIKNFLILIIPNIILLFLLILFKNIFSKNILILNIIIICLGLFLVGMYCFIIHIKEYFLIIKINKKINN